jgi:hypothetical protein
MAGLIAALNAPAIALTAATPKTVAMLTAPTNQALKIKEIRVTTDGATSTAVPVTVELGRPSSAGTFTSSTPLKRDTARSETVQATGGINASSEPTWTSVIHESLYVPAYSGVYHYIVPFDNEILVAGGGRFGVRCTAPAGVNASATIVYEE